MKRTALLVLSVFLVFLLLTVSQTRLISRQAQPPAGYANDPDNSGVSNCTSCHNGTVSTDSTKFTLKIGTTQANLANVVSGSTTYQADSTYWMSLTAVGTSTDHGFEITAVKSDNNMAGSFTLTSTTTTTLGTYTPSGYTVRQYVGHKNAYSSPQTTWQFKWTAPHTALGPVTFYYVGMNGNGQDNESGDVVYRNIKTIHEAVSTPAPTVSIALTSGTNPTCAGSSLTFTATSTNGGASPTYQWKVNGTNAGTGATFTTSSLTNGQAVTCVVTATGGLNATSNSISVTINPTVTPSVSISATSATTLCSGQPFSFSASPVNGGTSPTYQWKVNGNNVGSGATFSSALNNNDAVICVLTSNAACVSPTTATSNSISVTVSGSVTPTISISTGTPSVCAGQTVSFTSSITNGGSSPSYQWKINGSNSGIGSSFSSVLNNNDIVTCVLTSNSACATTTTATSNSVTVTINPASAPTITINTPSTSICSGQVVAFTSSITNGGSAPSYQWKVNGNNAGTGSTFSSVLNNNDIVTCVLTSNATCATTTTATSNSITITIGGSVVPAITISADNTTVCPGATVHFTATAANGGSAPIYQWKVNGNNAGTGGSTFATVPINGDVVSCVLTSNSACVSTTTATSNTVTITTSGTVTPLVSISADNTNVCVGGVSNFTATPVNGGSSPTYQWKKNGTNAGTGSTYSSSFSDGDIVTCVMTSSSSCASVPTATSNSVTIHVHSAPTVTIAPAGTVSVCANDSVQLTATGGATFVWSNSATGSSVWVSQQGSYSVTASEFGCTATSNTVNVTVASGPTASITQNGNTLIASAGSAFQWYLNGNEIVNSIGQAYVAQQSGNYSVKVTDANGCSNVSSEVNVTVSGVTEIGLLSNVKLYPVPNTGSFVVETGEPANVQLSVTDMYGRLIFFKQEISAKENITIDDLAPQIYFVTLRNENKMKVLKMEVK